MEGGGYAGNFYGGHQGDGFQNFPNLQYPLDPAPWYAPTPVMASPYGFIPDQIYDNYQGTCIGSNTFGEFSPFSSGLDAGFYEEGGVVPLLPSLPMEQLSGFGCVPAMEQISGFDGIPVMEQTSGFDGVPVMEQIPGFGSVPMMEQMSSFDGVPMMEQMSSFDSVPMMEQISGFDSISVMENISGVDSINNPEDGGQCLNWGQLTHYPHLPNQDLNNNVTSPPKEFLQGGTTSNSKNFTKRQWTKEEDSKLYALVMEFGSKDWVQIASRMEGRARKQCRKRWYNHVHPDIKKDEWSESEERILVEAHQKMGNKWAEIARMIPGRTENAIKNHWNATKRKKTLRYRRSKKNESNNGEPRSTVLLDYIRGNNFTSAGNTTNTTISTTNVSLPTITDNNVTPGNFTAIQPDDRYRSMELENGNFTAIPPDDLSMELENPFHNLPNSYSIDDQSPSLDMIIPTHDDESTFMKSLFGDNNTTIPQPKITASREPLVQPLEPISSPNMNTLELDGNLELGSSSLSIPIDGISNMHLNNNSPTNMSTTQFSPNPYLPFPMDFTTMFSNPTDYFYNYGDMNFDFAYNAQGDIGSPEAPVFPIF